MKVGPREDKKVVGFKKLLNVIYGHSLVGSRVRGPQVSHSKQPYQIWLSYFKRFWSSGSGNKRVHHFNHQVQIFQRLTRSQSYMKPLLDGFCDNLIFLLTQNLYKITF
jgi:hypothetical protein